MLLEKGQIEYIEKFATLIFEVISIRVPELIYLARFGSTLHRFVSPVVDLDILFIVPNNERNYLVEIEAIKELRNTILAGKILGGFNPVPENLQIDIINLCKAHTQDWLTICPAFCFGPYPMPAAPDKPITLYLHLNGPVCIDAFEYFCEQLPFHGTSILSNHCVIKGNPDVLHFELSPPSLESLSFWCRGLLLRVQETQDQEIIVKSIKKCLHMACIAHACFSNDPTIFLPLFKKLYGIDDCFFEKFYKNDLHQTSIHILKNQFYEIYRRITEFPPF